MNKKEAIEEFIKKVYTSNSNLVFSKKEIQKFNQTYKMISDFDDEFDALLKKI